MALRQRLLIENSDLDRQALGRVDRGGRELGRRQVPRGCVDEIPRQAYGAGQRFRARHRLADGLIAGIGDHDADRSDRIRHRLKVVGRAELTEGVRPQK